MAQQWEVHPSPYGVPYYYNPKTKESRWTVPTGPLDRILPPESKKPEPKEEEAKPAEEASVASRI